MQDHPNDNQTVSNHRNIQGGRHRNFLFHLHPPKVSNASIQFNRTFGLGGMALLLFVVQVLTGILLRFAYVPTPEKAYDSILNIDNNILFGGFVRNIHHWSGIFFVLISFLHFIRVFYAQAIYVPRRVNWIIGIALLILTIFSNFTGYLLPWDQLSYWAVTVSTNMLSYIPFLGEALMRIVRGGHEVDSATLLIFYNFHTGILPVAMILLMVWHFWKVRKAKGVTVPAGITDSRVPTNPDLLLKELVVGLILLAVILLLSSLFDAPLLDRANPAYSPNPAKAPWYFMGIQELLLHIHPFFAFVIIPICFFGGLIWFPYAIKSTKQGVWFHSEKGKKLSIQSVVITLILTPIAILLEEYVLHFENWMPGWPKGISEGLVPFLLLAGSLSVYLVIIRRKYKANNIEMAIVLFTVFIIAYLILSIIGIWFRGEGMILSFPWKI